MPKKKKNGSRFVALPYFMMHHPTFRQLSPNAVRLFIELKMIFNGSNNGHIALSCRDAGERCGFTRNTAGKAFKELEYYGFIILRRVGHFGNRHASEYILTCEAWNNQPATNNWKTSRPKMPKDWLNKKTHVTLGVTVSPI